MKPNGHIDESSIWSPSEKREERETGESSRKVILVGRFAKRRRNVSIFKERCGCLFLFSLVGGEEAKKRRRSAAEKKEEN